MPKVNELSNVWKTIKEVDLRPLREQALKGVQIALVGAPCSGRHTLAEQMRRDPSRPDIHTEAPVKILGLEQADQAAGSDLVILVVDARKADFKEELDILQILMNAGMKTLLFANTFPAEDSTAAIAPWSEWRRTYIVQGSALESEFLHRQFAATAVELTPHHAMGLGRDFPLFRHAAATYLINDACLSNAAYSLTTGLAQIVPVFDIPLTVTDMIVLSKTQAFLAYKLGLTLGFSTNWQDYMREFGGVLGGGFVLRQLARSLVGLIPVWGILPKVAIAYAGTYVVGHTILQWYLTGRHLTKGQMRDLYRRAFLRGKTATQPLLKKRAENKARQPRLPKTRRKALPAGGKGKNCPTCGQSNIEEANFCQNCGYVFGVNGKEVESNSP
jgi:uncharacterized protein (DUF697 family)